MRNYHVKDRNVGHVPTHTGYDATLGAPGHALPGFVDDTLQSLPPTCVKQGWFETLRVTIQPDDAYRKNLTGARAISSTQ